MSISNNIFCSYQSYINSASQVFHCFTIKTSLIALISIFLARLYDLYNIRTSIFSSDVTMMSFFNITFNKSVITNHSFCKAFKMFIIFFSHNKLFIKMLFHHATAIITFFDHISDKRRNSISS